MRFGYLIARTKTTCPDVHQSTGGGELLSFIPQTYTMKTDGRIAACKVYSIQKRYTPEKHYVMILEVTRENEKVPSYLFRTYQQFRELDSKLGQLYSDETSNLR